ncbi:hypothetical protein G647_01050 [Cladophialophora carrionii CBS 160.54]|uniref:SET domain-containing protein n=1 Tax=Cladophialophora carrionii CBS 160.54 TaxID=1279043 RepID=V9DNW7_9EURO|nr:uncharacterized protein G647_01050 [Cladophialophora carrionii CBS 160.54]ETI28599.1 hypothetical protein G647_01050 [Cladophialophora carrionii CBS 160.54]
MARRLLWTWRHIVALSLSVCVSRVFTTSVAQSTGAAHQVAFDQLLHYGQLELDLHTDDEGQEDGSNVKGENSFLPWSYEPICTEHLARIQSKLCVYTDASFSNGRGISIFTTPQHAETVASLLDSDAEDYRPMINIPTQAWYTETTPSKGIGMFASHDLNPGDLITSYTPVLLAYKENILSRAERETFLRHAVNRLPSGTAAGYRALATMFHDKAFLMQDVASANSFEMSVGGAAHLAVIPEPSRINHDCAPNAIFVINSTALAHTVRATRPIAKDDEITIAYTNPLDGFVKRRKYLLDSFGFECTCSRCRRGESGDAALAEITALQKSLSRWSDPTSTASTKQAERLIQTHREQGLDGYLDPAYCLAALVYNSVGSERGAKKYTKLCIEAIELRLGPGAEDLPTWREMLVNVKGHWSWMRRKRG